MSLPTSRQPASINRLANSTSEWSTLRVIMTANYQMVKQRAPFKKIVEALP